MGWILPLMMNFVKSIFSLRVRESSLVYYKSYKWKEEREKREKNN
jgi:hypothetical protein